MRSESFATPGYMRLDVDNETGSVEVTAGDTATTEIEVSSDRDGSEIVDATRIESRPVSGGVEVVVHVPRRKRVFLRGETVRVIARVPLGADLTVRTASAEVDGAGVFGKVDIETASGKADVDEGGEVRLRSASGDLSLGAAQSLRARSASGDILVGRLAERSTLHTASGSVRLGAAGADVKVETVSGSLAVDVAERDVTAKTVSGDVRLTCIAAGEVVVQTVSGDAVLGVAPGRAVEVDAHSLSGQLASEIGLDATRGADGGPVGRVRIKFNSVSGDLRIQRAEEPVVTRTPQATPVEPAEPAFRLPEVPVVPEKPGEGDSPAPPSA